MRKSLLVGAVAGAALVAAIALSLGIWSGSGSGQPALAASTSPSAVQQPATPQPGTGQQSGIFVTGEGVVNVKPDVASVTVGVEVTDPTASGAQQQAAAQMDPVIAALKNQGVEDKDIKTVSISLSPDYDYSTQTPVLKGYRATNLVQVTIRDVSKVGQILDAVTGQGATRIYGISFDVSDQTAAGAQGRELAMNQARDKAEQLAKLAGVTLGRPISIQEQVSAQPMPVQVRSAPAAAPSVATPVSPGTQEVRTTVQVVYSIQ